MTVMPKARDGRVGRPRQDQRDAWPEVIACLRAIGIAEMRIYLLGRRLFMYMEAVDGFSPERDFPKLAEDARYREWDELMRGFQQPAPEDRAGEWWATMGAGFDTRPT